VSVASSAIRNELGFLLMFAQIRSNLLDREIFVIRCHFRLGCKIVKQSPVHSSLKLARDAPRFSFQVTESFDESLEFEKPINIGPCMYRRYQLLEFSTDANACGIPEPEIQTSHEIE